MEETKELRVQSISKLLAKQFPESKWLIEKLIPESSLVLMSAAPASFKTWLALEISLCIADGKSLFGLFPSNQGNVLICDEESGERMLQDRFKKLGAEIADEPWKEQQIFYLSRIGRQVDDEYMRELTSECLKNNIKLVIFDSLVRFHNARENDASEMAKILNFFKTLNDKGVATLVLHHNRKSGNGGGGGGEMIRGSSDILASCDVHLSVSRRKKRITVFQTKNRYIEEITPFSVQLRVVDENRSVFEYLGEENDKEERATELRSLLIQKIVESPGINKSQLINSVSQEDDSLANNRIMVAINNLINDKVITTKQGVKNSLCLYINENND